MSTAQFDTLSDRLGTVSVPVDTVVNGSAKAWVNFNGTGTVAIRAAFNVTSITDNGTGDYTVNFTNALVDANYAVAGTPGGGNFYPWRTYDDATPKTTSALRVIVLNNVFAAADPVHMHLAVFR